MDLGCGEYIPVAELVGCFEEKVRTRVPARNRKPGFIEHISGIAGPVRRAQSRAPAEKFDLGGEKRVRDLAGRSFLGQGRRPDFDRSG